MVPWRSAGVLLGCVSGLVMGLWHGAGSQAEAQLRGVAGDRIFSVNAPDQAAAEMLLAEARRLRRHLALRWLGSPLPQNRGATVIHWELSPDRDEGITWPAVAPPRQRHLVWLKTSFERVRATLAHEMVHVVLFTRFGDSLPVWLHEGIAATEDDARTRARRTRILASWLRRQRLPALVGVLTRRRIPPEDQQAYTAAVLLTEYLLSRGDASRLFRFAQSGVRRGWNEAASSAYGTGDLEELERDWHRWLRQRESAPLTLRPRPDVRLR